jgi:hypothetical protein
MCVLVFSTNFSEICFVLKRAEGDMMKNVKRSSRKVPDNLMKLEFSGQILEKYSTTKFIENPSSWRRVVP